MSFNTDFNTDITFSMIPQLYVPPFNMSIAISTFFPDEFSWAIEKNDDSVDIKKKKKLITKSQSQYNCGCCYAMAVATCISDVFVVSGLGWNPMISTTYLMQNFKKLNGKNVQNRCQGGNPAVLLAAVEQSDGVVSDKCVDYSWCTSNRYCINLSELKGNKLRDYLNTVITPEGCFFSTKKEDNINKPIIRNVYKIKNVRTIPYDLNLTSQNVLKNIIYNNGPIIMGFIVHNNFVSGNFKKHNGIYFHNGNYTQQKEKFYNNNFLVPIEKHAVVIVGWGVSYTDVDNVGTKKHVPYWHCRNTFGPEWGEKGYFKYAMHPYNETIRIKGLGGYLLFEASNIIKKNVSNTTILPTLFEKNKKYYQQDDDISSADDNNKNDIKIIIGVILFLFFIVIFIFNL